MFGLFAFFVLLSIVLTWAPIILVFVSSWKVHTKAGLHGWSGILPYYNYYVRAEKHNNTKLFWRSLIFVAIAFGIMLVGTLVVGIVGTIAALSLQKTAETVVTIATPMIITFVLGAIVYIATMVMMVLAMIQLVKIDIDFIAPFGKGKGFAIGMLLLPFVFYPVLAWGKNDVKDPNIIDVDGAPIN